MSEEVQYLSMTDLEMMEDSEVELAGVDPTVDANAQPAPIPAGKYLVKVKHRAEDPSKAWIGKKTSDASKNPGQPYVATELVCEVAENPINPKETHGRKFVLFDRDMRTLIGPNGSCEVIALLQGLGKGPEVANGPQKSARYAAMLSKALASEPLVGVEIDWEARFYDKDTKTEPEKPIRGMKNFPKNEKGVHNPTVVAGGIEATARTFVRRWIQVHELTGGSAALHGVSAPPPLPQQETVTHTKPVQKPVSRKA